MADESAKVKITSDPELLRSGNKKILGFGEEFPLNPNDGFCFTKTSKSRKQQFIYNAENDVWQEVGNDATSNPGTI